MRKVTCASCGRPYDYDSDDFCPKCGSYNSPPDRAGARPAQAPPARVSAASKDRPRPAAQPKTPPVGPRTVSYGGPQGGTPWEEPPARRQRSPLKLLVIVLVSLFLLCIVLPFVLGLMLNLSEAFAGRRPEPGAVAQAEPAGGTHALWEPFSIHGTQQVTVEDPWEVDLTYVPLARREGFRCLAVDLWVEGGEADAQSLTEAAILAATFSQAGEGSRVPVDYTPVKYVKKPAGARPGMVVYTTYQTAVVDPDPELAKRLRVK